MMRRCRYCQRGILERDGAWIDPEATGDDAVWSETCDRHDTFTAEHSPEPQRYAVYKDPGMCPHGGRLKTCHKDHMPDLSKDRRTE